MSRGKGTDMGKCADYDPRTSIYTPEGRLYLVEKTIEAVKSTGTRSIGVLGANWDCILGVTDKKVQEKLLHQTNQNTKIPHSPPGKNSEKLEDQNLIPRHGA